MGEKGRFLKKHRGNECLNCNVPLDIIDRYCHNCGQINTTKKISLNDFFAEFFASIFSYDSRLRHTINSLLFNPGKISKEYIEGKRVKYANPFRFYLSVSIIFFIIYGLFIDFDSVSAGFEDDINKGKKAINEIEQNIPIDTLKKKINDQIMATEGITSLEKEKINKTFTKIEEAIPLNSIQKKINQELTQSNDSLQTKQTSFLNEIINESEEVIYYSQEQLDTLSFFSKTTKLWSMYDDYYNKTGQKSAYRALDSLNHKKTRFNKYIYHRAIKTNDLDETYGQELIEFIISKLPFIIFFFLPLFALAIWLLYIRKSFNYMEHLVFIFHTQTMFFILLGITILLGEIIKSEAVTGIAMLVFLFYLYKAMRTFYNQGRAKTIVKFLLVNVLFFILAGIGSLLTIAGSIFIF